MIFNLANRFFTIAVTILAILALSSKAGAAEIAVVDLKEILKNSNAMNAINRQINEQRKKYQKDIAGEESELREKQKDIKKKKAIMSDQAFQESTKDFHKEIVKMQRDVNQKAMTLEKAFIEARKKVLLKVDEIVTNIAKKRGFNIAVQKVHTIYYQESLDITDEVLDNLNKSLPYVKVSLQK